MAEERGRYTSELEQLGQEALDAAFARLGPDATVLAMPYGGSTLPRAKA